MKIRKANIIDALAIAEVRVDTWQTTYRGIIPDEHLDNLSYEDAENSFSELISKNNCFLYVAENEVGEIVGFAAAGAERFENPYYQGEIYAMYVLKNNQRQGIGTLLFRSMLKELKQLGFFSVILWVLAGNRYKKFYEDHGGKQIEFKIMNINGFDAELIGYGWPDISRLNI
ncbi:L-amino acid N-acyltransferase YncA [Desulfotomaculum arcticum]|uniref:L-amino acid N-acyltransferase YncA n=1 Tax=Desulfotruncus arcticus DSM 17038 TaxID=1121424 RepID=A0A1I2W538_9FIRM|nr:GNAT family N-acetyltransferase [Desulfotruncus arcticus]SFG95769.1 L-amino acid N-acyltransferase YncA [Desulfotomaculum arcticum] [Desulfotruncus arcticus DSM 17038]